LVKWCFIAFIHPYLFLLTHSLSISITKSPLLPRLKLRPFYTGYECMLIWKHMSSTRRLGYILLQHKFEVTTEVIRIVNRRTTNNAMVKRKKGQRTNNNSLKTLHRKLKTPLKPRVDSCAPSGLTIPSPLNLHLFDMVLHFFSAVNLFSLILMSTCFKHRVCFLWYREYKWQYL
jgi:hypothetical protein